MKLTVFLVEDETPTRKGIRENIPWDLLDLNYVGEARNGAEAYPMILDLKPDILITDIKMPNLNGIDLSSLIRAALPRTKIILISAFDEFTFAQQAIEIGVHQYVLKPITPNKLVSSLQKVKSMHTSETLALRQSLEEVEGGDSPLPPFEHVGATLGAGDSVIAVVPYLESESTIARISRLYEKEKTLHFFSGSPAGFLITGENTENCRENAYRFVNSLEPEIIPEACCCFAFGSIGVGDAGAVESYERAVRTRNHRHLFGDAGIISYAELEILLSNNRKLVSLDSDSMINFILEGKEEQAGEFLDELFQSPKNISLGMRYYLIYTATELLSTLSAFIVENIGDPADYLPELQHPDHLLDRCSSIEGAVASLTPIMKSTLSLRKKIKSPYFSLIQKAVLDIEHNYQDPNYSLLVCAEAQGMSPAYFSTIFKQTVGSSFIKYLTKNRIEQAKSLLKSTTLQAAEISRTVGYRDAHYFSFVFRKNVGITPTAYREESDTEAD